MFLFTGSMGEQGPGGPVFPHRSCTGRFGILGGPKCSFGWPRDFVVDLSACFALVGPRGSFWDSRGIIVVSASWWAGTCCLFPGPCLARLGPVHASVYIFCGDKQHPHHSHDYIARYRYGSAGAGHIVLIVLLNNTFSICSVQYSVRGIHCWEA